MVRRFFPTAALILCAGIYVWAAERATFVLNDGERKGGSIVFHGSDHENLINGHLNLGNDAGGEQSFPLDQVAVIDFAGGHPSAMERQALPSDDSHLLVLRNGVTQQGRLINLVNGDTLLWQNQGGEHQRYAIRDVSRVYLNPQVARTAYLHNERNEGQSTGEGGAVGRTVVPGAVRVDATQPWVDTGVMVKKGDRVAFNATGQIQFSPNPAHTASPDGNPGVQTGNLPVASMSVGGLIAKVGNSPPFPIGMNNQPITMPSAGHLLLGINDTDLSDNSGFFSVVVRKQ
jgi:hypothetical protein